jgi:tRNA nucleotidyltransferase (CCA-adding enzyme)
VEDPTRILRAIRFEQRFGFKIGKLTLALIKNAVKINALKDYASRRLFLELRLILNEQDPVRAIKRMNEFDLLQFISLEIQFNKSLELLLEEIKKVIAWYNLLYLEEPFEPWKVYWHGLNSSLGTKSLHTMAENIGMVDLDSRRLISQRATVNTTLDNLCKFSGNNYQLYTLLSPYDTESLLYLMAKANTERTKRLISSYFTRLKGTKIQLKGKDLSIMGFQPGPIFREIFDRLLEARLNNLIKTKEDEVRFVQDTFQLPSP